MTPASTSTTGSGAAAIEEAQLRAMAAAIRAEIPAAEVRLFGSRARGDARSLLAIAEHDLLAAQGMTNADTFHEVIWGFQVQQVVEKALKAWLYDLDQSPPFTHDLVSLFKLLIQSGVDITPHRELARFTAFAVQFRYDAEPEPMGLDRQHWLQRAEALVEHVEQIACPRS